jgi:hypothetical protein
MIGYWDVCDRSQDGPLVETVRPTREYLRPYERCQEKLDGFGLDYPRGAANGREG